MSTTSTTTETEALPDGEAGLFPGLNARGAPIHRDLYKHSKDPEADRRHELSQARTLGIAFFIFFSLFLSGISMLFNGAHRSGFAATFPKMPEKALPTEDEAARQAFEEQVIEVQAAGDDKWVEVQQQHLYVLGKDDPEPNPDDVDGMARIDINLERSRVAVAYAELKGQPGRMRLPNAEPSPVRTCAHNAFLEAKLLKLVPTRFVMGLGVLLGLLAVFVPAVLVPFYNWWMRSITAPLGWFNTRVILGIVWVVMITPLAIWLAIRRKWNPKTDILRRDPNAPEETYWITREKKRSHKHFQRLF